MPTQKGRGKWRIRETLSPGFGLFNDDDDDDDDRSGLIEECRRRRRRCTEAAEYCDFSLSLSLPVVVHLPIGAASENDSKSVWSSSGLTVTEAETGVRRSCCVCGREREGGSAEDGERADALQRRCLRGVELSGRERHGCWSANTTVRTAHPLCVCVCLGQSSQHSATPAARTACGLSRSVQEEIAAAPHTHTHTTASSRS
ncbi:hypothetical protein chiPu_0012880 [Chiloscyllium punctatum]|uniref:Uncharacterized protein n=1 Tax=Chiloscyllium punctatum TaxID=137246 RepID=A0A401SVH7_CHIPU|nr:hypothetical protein [Chiloscyllium punctatum]